MVNLPPAKVTPHSWLRCQPVAIDNAKLTEYLQFAHALADQTGPAIKQWFRSKHTAENKSSDVYDPVTEADRQAEAMMREAITHHYPLHGIFGEEFGYAPGDSGLTWVLDPIDGTRAFISGIPLWGSLIALFDGVQPILGLMDQPYTGERFWAAQGNSYFQRDNKCQLLHTSNCQTLDDAILYNTHPGMFTKPSQRQAFERIQQRVKLCRFSGDCYAYCMLANGHIDLIIEADLKPYDIHALIPIVEYAGGIFTNWEGAPAIEGGTVVAASSIALHQQALAILKSA